MLPEQSYLTLYQLNQTIRETLEERFSQPLWVIAEISETSVSRGHMYLTLVQKEGDEIIAQSRATIWASRTYLLQQFTQITRENLRKGMEILLLATVRYHEKYGLSLDILNLMPEFTLGGMAQKRRETIARLQREGLLEANKFISWRSPVRSIAVISSATAAGYQDFLHQLDTNPYGYKYHCDLFPALVQGDQAEKSMIQALAAVKTLTGRYDVIALLRGGGSQLDMSCFDGYDLCAHLARLPLPVITGIGHEKDESVADMVAHTRCKTPTAVADLIVSDTLDYESEMISLWRSISYASLERINLEGELLEHLRHRISSRTPLLLSGTFSQLERLAFLFSNDARKRLAGEELHLRNSARRLNLQCMERALAERGEANRLQREMGIYVRHLLERNNQLLDEYERDVMHFHPGNILRRGFSITRLNGRAVRNTDELQSGVKVRTELHKGYVTSIVESTETKNASE